MAIKLNDKAVDLLTLWARESYRLDGNTTYGPRFNGAMRVARAILALTDPDAPIPFVGQDETGKPDLEDPEFEQMFNELRDSQ